MAGQGKITRSPKRQIKILLAAQVLWLALVCVLGAWWGTLLLKQAAHIAQLEQASGLAASEAHAHWLRTHQMLVGESITFFGLLLASTILLFLLYWRDARRTRSLQTFFASLTHELRTPLTSIRLQAESISDTLKDSQDRELIHRLMEDSQRLEQQVERILELARLEGGGPIFTQPIALAHWLERLVREWSSHRGHSGKIQVRLDLEKLEGVQIMADQVALQVILRNLLENSIRHARCESLEIEIGTEVTADGVFLVFRDNGQGFEGSPKQLGKLFEKGERSQGAGVGLYLVTTLMKKMGGFARFEVAQASLQVNLFFPVSSGVTHG